MCCGEARQAAAAASSSILNNFELQCRKTKKQAQAKRLNSGNSADALTFFPIFVERQRMERTSVLFPVHTFLLQVLLVRFPYNHRILITNFTLCTV